MFKRVFIIVFILVTAGFGCQSNNSNVVEEQQKRIDELSKKVEELSTKTVPSSITISEISTSTVSSTANVSPPVQVKPVQKSNVINKIKTAPSPIAKQQMVQPAVISYESSELKIERCKVLSETEGQKEGDRAFQIFADTNRVAMQKFYSATATEEENEFISNALKGISSYRSIYEKQVYSDCLNK